MKWLLVFLATSAFATEPNVDLQSRLLGTAGPTAVVETMAEDGHDAPMLEVPARPEMARSKPSTPSVAGVGSIQTVMSLWPFFLALLAAAGFLVMRKKGLTIPGLTKVAAAPKVPMTVVSRNSLGGNASILLVDVEGANGVIRRLLLGTGGNATPSLVTDLGVRGGKTPASDAIPESITFTTTNQAPAAQRAPGPKRTAAPVRATDAPISVEAPEAEYDDHEYDPEGVEPGTDPLNTRLRRVHRHRNPGRRPVTRRGATSADGANWRVNSFDSGTEAGPTEVDKDGVSVRVSGSKSHLESLAAHHKTSETEAPKPQVPEAADRKRLDVSNAFEAELRRRVYDATPGERKARSDAARALVDQMIQERMSEVRSA